MIVLHQGSGSPRRGSVRFHSLETWLFRERGRRMLARTRQMADFGEAVAELPGRARSRESWRLLPVPGCRPSYEEWATALDVGGVFQRTPGLRHPQRDHAVRPGRPRAHGLQQARRLRASRPRGLGVALQGRPPRRVPSALVRCATTARRASAPTHTGGARSAASLQIVSRRIRIDQRRERDGVENAFIAEQPSDGGIFRAGRGSARRRASSSRATACSAATRPRLRACS